MHNPILRFTLYAMIIYLTCGALNSTVTASPTSGDNGTHFHGVTDSQWNKRHSDQFPNRHYARTAAANLNVGEPRTVRMIYFLPNDRPYRAQMVRNMKYLILKVQTFYAEQMEAHGYGRRTFRIETDPQGEPVVHRVDGQHPDSYYVDDRSGVYLDEIERAGFDIRANVYLIAMDINGDGGYAYREGKNGGEAVLLGNVRFGVAAHELGHAFGLPHDFRDETYIMSYGGRQTRLSACAADYLSVHPYFNPDTPIEEGPPPSIELISSRRYPAGAKSFPIRLKVRGSTGLHQVLLSTSAPILSSNSVKSCQLLDSEREVVVEFNYDGTNSTPSHPQGTGTSLSDPLAHLIDIELVDTDGNVDFVRFPLYSEAFDEPLMKISGDNQVGLPNTPLPAPFVVHMLNQFTGRSPYGGVPNVPLTFTVTAGGGTLSVEHPWVAFEAESTLTLGPNLGTNTVEVSAAGFTVTFNAEAVAPEDIPYVNIPDPNLQSAIEDELGASPGTPITQTAMATLIKLEAFNENINDLTGLETATNLQELGLSGDFRRPDGEINSNSVSNLFPLAGLSHLSVLFLGNNSIVDISALSGLTQLGKLWLDGNNISDISVLSGLTNLISLRLDDNNISDFSPVVGLPLLRVLRLGGNNISDFSALSGLTQLSYLDLDGSNISDISVLSNLTNLERLVLSENTIMDISVIAGLTNLFDLDLDGNNISDISALSGLTNLGWLFLNGNNISDISALSGLTNLSLLVLDGNNVSDISALSGLTNLEWLFLDGNNVSDLSPLVENMGLNALGVEGNPLSYQSIHTHIPTLQKRGVSVEFDNQAHPALLKISGDNQTGASFVSLSQPFVVEAQDANGSVLAGVSVTFIVTGGGGTLSTTITRTDNNGRAQSRLILGPNLGTNTVKVSAAGIESPATFYAIADSQLPPLTADVNSDGLVNVLDLILIASSLGQSGQSAADVNEDRVVDILDLVLAAGMFDDAAAAPSAQPEVPETLTAVEVQGWLTDARSLEAKDPIMKRGIMMLEQLLVSLTPKETELLANYPNPFNPETWIPYRLAEDAFVTLTIYDGSGQAVRTLDIGHRIASAYETRSKAVYWDGRNALGEQVASGVYFYTLTTGDYSATRKMVILK